MFFRSAIFPGRRFFPVLALAGLLFLPRVSPAQDWPWGVASHLSLGTAVLVTAPGIQRPPGPLAVTDKLDIYACGYAKCEDGKPITLALRAPGGRAGGRPLTTDFNQRFLALDLPPGSYRLARMESSLDHVEGRLTFELEIHYIFNVRAGRTTYLGRLVATPLESDAVLIWSKEKRGQIVTGETVSGPFRRQVFHLSQEEYPYTDASAVMRAFPERDFFPFSTEKMEWIVN